MNIKIGDKYILSDFERDLYSDRVQFNIPNTEMTIDYIDQIIVGNLKYLRYYFKKTEGFIEKNMNTNKHKIFIKDMEIFPNNQSDWDNWKNLDSGLVGSTNFIHGDYEYERLWNSSTKWIEPIEFKKNNVEQKNLPLILKNSFGMLYFRKDNPSLASPKKSFNEFLLLQLDDEKIEMYLGVNIQI
jgi:hypothetical protein